MYFVKSVANILVQINWSKVIAHYYKLIAHILLNANAFHFIGDSVVTKVLYFKCRNGICRRLLPLRCSILDTLYTEYIRPVLYIFSLHLTCCILCEYCTEIHA